MPKISLAGPADLLSVIPFHLGFDPRRSVVVVCLHDKRVGLIARFDLPPDELAKESVEAHLATLVRARPTSVWLVGFEDEQGESARMSGALRSGLRQHRVEVNDRLVVRDGRWFSIDCDCCPKEGWLLPEVADVPAVAEYVALGHSVLPNRESLAALVAPLSEDDPSHAEAEAAVDRWQARYTVCSAFDRLRARGLLIDDLSQVDSDDLDDLAGFDDELLEALGYPADDELADDDQHDWDSDLTDGAPWTGPAADVAAVIDLAAARARLGPGNGDGAPDTTASVDPAQPGEEITPFARLRAESLRAWGGVLRGEIEVTTSPWVLPALVGSLRDLQLRDGLVAWLCPGSLPLDALPDALVELLEVTIGADVHAAAAGQGVLPDPGPPERPARSGRRVRRQRGRRDVVSEAGDPARHGNGAPTGLREWEEAGAPHTLQARLEAVCRATPASHAAPVLAVTGNIAWWHGDGARAGVALDAALELEPDHRLAGLIRRALDLGLRGGGAAGEAQAQAHADRQRPGESGSWNRPSSA